VYLLTCKCAPCFRYYLCYKQTRDATAPGYNTYTFLKYLVVHIHHAPP